MKQWIGIFVLVAFIFTMIMPAAAHAHSVTNTTSHANAMTDCNHDSAKAVDDHHTHGKHKTPCCNTDMCKCATGTCHGGVAKTLSYNEAPPFPLAFTKIQFGFSDEFMIDSALLERLKRPPRA